VTLELLATPTPPADARAVLGGFVLAAAHELAADWPCQRVRAPVLGEHRGCWWETWQATGPSTSGSAGGLRWRRVGDLLFGLVEVDESALDCRPGASRLEQAAEHAYQRLFALLDSQGLPHLWRVWNYLPDIHGQEAGLERYRRFNLGRARGFESAARSVVGRVPAACALGVRGGPLSVAFLAGPTAAVPIENPRQVSAFRYPPQYGPRSPTFARAALVHPPGQEWLFISGTASIVGHETVHPGDAAAQCRETVDNLEAVIAQANACRRASQSFGLDRLGLRAYIRHAGDLAAVRQVLDERCPDASLLCVQADVCREDLLVEIEAWGALPC
jgi:chorismate lyase / 3-hydroxybenzoate synthase